MTVNLLNPYFDLKQIISIIIGVLGAIGITEGLKRIVLYKFSEKIEKWKLNFFEKQTIREDIYNFIAFGQSNFYQNFPNTADLANIYKITYKLNNVDRKLSVNLGHFVFQWMMYVYLKDKNMSDLRDKAKAQIDKLSDMIIDDINRKL